MKFLYRRRFSFTLPLIVSILYLFLYIPIAVLIIFSWNDAPFPAPWVGFTWRWYKELFVSARLWQAFANSLIIAVTATLLSCLGGVALIFYASHKFFVERFFVLFYGNIIIPEIVLAVALLGIFSFFSVPLGMSSLIVSHTILGLGYVIPILYTQFKEVDPRLLEASLDLGASQSATFFRITLPLLIPALLGAALLVFVISFDDFLLAFFLGGANMQTLSLYIFAMIRSGVTPVINALSTLMLLLSSLLVIVFCSLNVRSRIL